MSFTPFCSSCCPTGPSAHASSGATVRRPAHAQTGEFPITRWLLILGGQPAEIDTAACLEALRCCNKRWRAFFAEVLPDGHFLWRQLLKQLHIGRHGPALVRFADLVNAHTENINYKERFWLALKKPYEYVTKPLVLSMFRLLDLSCAMASA